MILECLILRLHADIEPTSPKLLSVLSTIRAHIGTQSQFYTCVDIPDRIYIFGQWATLGAHQAFLASGARRQAILQPQEQLTDFLDMGHLDLGGGPDGRGIQALPIKAPVISFARFWIRRDATDAVDQLIDRVHRPTIVAGCAPWPVVDGWRIDDPDPAKLEVPDPDPDPEGNGNGSGKGDAEGDSGHDQGAPGPLKRRVGREWLMLSGWDSIAAHDAFRKSGPATTPDYGRLGEFALSMEAVHLLNLEAGL